MSQNFVLENTRIVYFSVLDITNTLTVVLRVPSQCHFNCQWQYRIH